MLHKGKGVLQSRRMPHELLTLCLAATALLWALPATASLGPDNEGTYLLHASNAVVHGSMLRYEPQTNKNCLGYWVNADDWAEWSFHVDKPGGYEIEVWQGCGKDQGGSDVALEVGGKRTIFAVEETGHFQIFIPRRLGQVCFPKGGDYSISVKPQRKQASAIMDIRQVRLIPVSQRSKTNSVLESVLNARRIVFLGDSITYAGGYIDLAETWLRTGFPNSPLDIIDLGLPSETVSGLTEPGHAGGAFPRPVLSERLSRVLDKAKPALIFACYGMNDGIYYPFDEQKFRAFQRGIIELREQAKAAGADIIHLTPPTFDSVPLRGHTLPAGEREYRIPFEGYNTALDKYSSWLMSQRTNGWKVIDIHEPMNRFLNDRRKAEPAFVLATDGVHVNAIGHWIIAREILRALGADTAICEPATPSALLETHPHSRELLKLIEQKNQFRKDSWLNATGHKRPGMAKGKPLDEVENAAESIETKIRDLANLELPGKRSLWHGFERFDFEVDGKPVIVVSPKIVAPGRPWVWHGEFFGHKPEPDLALLGRGFHIVYMSVPNMFGSPAAVAHWNAFYEKLTRQFGFAKKAALVGLSRGGLYCYNWAEANPDKVACIYGDAPVCDFKSWPGAFGKGKRSDTDWQLLMKCYGFTNETEAKTYSKNPIDNLSPLAIARVPLLHIYGEADEVVPWQENTGIVAERYRKLGGQIDLIAKPGVGHHPHGLEDSTPIVDFIWKNAASFAARQWLGSHGNSPLDENEKPLIRKLGTIDLDLVETTPVVFNNRLWRFEWVRDGYWNNQRHTNYFRFRDPATGEVTPPFADGHEFGSAFVNVDTVFVSGTQNRSRINMFSSADLKSWETWTVLDDPRYGIFNTSVCKTSNDFVLMFEIDKPAEEAGNPFTARFLRSPDLKTWKLTPPECNYSKDRYTAPHALRWLDGWFYDFYLEAYNGYEMRVVRSHDLKTWIPSPLNPVLSGSPADKIIANPALTDDQRTRIALASNRNNSDIDFTEWHGQLRINYSWGNQLGVEHLSEAIYDGSLKQFLNGWFPAER